MLPFILTGYAVTPSVRYGATVGEARNAAEEAILPLENRIESLELACAGLWELLKQTSGLDDAQLIAKVREIDEKDGKVDGKIDRPALECKACGRRSLVRNAAKCTWCGAELGRGPF